MTIKDAVRSTFLSRRALVYGATTLAALAALGLYFYLHRSLPLPRVARYAQITHDGKAGDIIGIDGSSMYLFSGISHPIGKVAVSGGAIQPLSLPVVRPEAEDLSPDGSTLLVLSYGKGLTSSPPVYTVDLKSGKEHHLAEAAAAVWTPDGGSVVYFTPDGDAWLISRDGTNAHKWLSLGAVPDSFTWAPDGKTILYSKNGELWKMSSSGADPQELLHGWSGQHKCCGTWSPEGDYFVFVSGADSQLWAVDRQPTPSDPVQLTSGPMHWYSPVFSKDGKTLFASRSISGGQLVRLDASSHQLQPYLGGISAEHVSYSKDGKFVAYVTYPDGVLWKANRDGSGRVQLTRPPMYPRLPNWSPDGTQIVFVSSGSPQSSAQAWLVSSQGGTAKALLPEDPGPQTDPSWSPDGRQIAYSTSPEVGRGPNSEIRILDIASHRVTTLPGSTGRFSPQWSPDGKAMKVDASDGSSLYVFTFKSRQWSRVHEGLLAFAAWSRDSQSIFLQKYAEDAGIYRIPAKGGKEERVLDLHDVATTGYYGLWMGLDPTDAPLLMVNKGTDDVYALTLERGR